MNSRKELLYLILTCLYVMITFIANLITVKLIAVPLLPSLAIPSGLILIPFTFLITDLVAEIYGASKARLMVYLGFSLCLISQLILMLAIKIPPHPSGYDDPEFFQTAFSTVFGLSGIALVSSLIAYGLSQMLDIRLFSFLKEVTHGKHLWIRNGVSTWVSQIIDTLVVNVLFLYCGLKLELELVLLISLYSYMIKAVFTLINIPVFYLCVKMSNQFFKQARVTA
jgi:queuosine precursor transporter